MDFPEYARAIASRRRDRNLIAVQQTASTHLLGRRIVGEYGRESLRAPAAEVVAWTQTAGVGRDGRAWSSPPGKGVYLTVIRSLESADQVQLLPVAVAVSLCETICRWLRPAGGGGGGCRIKWPNDLFAGERKLGGILIDVSSPPRTPETRAAERAKPLASLPSRTADISRPLAVISVGVNVSSDLSAFAIAHATSVAAEAARHGGAGISLDAAAGELIAAIDAGLAPAAQRLLDDYRRLSLHRPGDRIRCRLDSGAVTGTFLGFDRRGFLRLRVAGEEHRIASGVIFDGG